MNLIENINKKLVFDKDEICAGGENDIAEIIRVSPVSLPEDYIEFLDLVYFFGTGKDGFGLYCTSGIWRKHIWLILLFICLRRCNSSGRSAHLLR